MTDNNSAVEQQPLMPNPDLKSLDKLVGTWKISGGSEGTVTYEWMEGGFFLIQHIDLNQAKGIEIIGHLRPFGEEGSPAYYKGEFSEDGNTLSGGWVYPGGGGYETVSTRMK